MGQEHSTKETPFVMAFGTKAVILAKVGVLTYQTEFFNEGENDRSISEKLDIMEEIREQAYIRPAIHKQYVERYSNRTVREKRFCNKDLVSIRVTLNT